MEDYKKFSPVTKYFKNGVERLQTDRGKEHEGACVEEHSATTVNIPQHNPFAERKSQTFLIPVKVIPKQSGLSSRYWEYNMDYAGYVKNRRPHSVLNMSPFEELTGNTPTLKYAIPFGCSAFLFQHSPVSPQERTQLTAPEPIERRS